MYRTRTQNSPGPGVPVRTERAAENRLPYVPLNLENNRATLRFATELEHEPGIRFRPDHYVKSSRGLVRLVPQLHPAGLEHAGPALGALQVDADVDPSQQLPAADAARAAHAARVNRHTERDGLAGESAEGGGIEVKTRGGGGGVRRRVAGRGAEREEGILGREVLDPDLAEARSGGWMDPWTGRFCRLWELQSQ